MLVRAGLLLEHVFMLWMLVHAVRSRAEYYWFLIIFMPFGEWAYFFAVRIREPDMSWLRDVLSYRRPPQLRDLRYRFRESPSLANKLALAQGLHDGGHYDEAAGLFGELVAAAPDDSEASYGLGLCREELGDPEGAVCQYRSLIERHRSFRDYAVVVRLAEVLWKMERREEALQTLAALVETSPRTSHRVIHAHHLAEDGRVTEARSVVDDALLYYAHAPRYVKRRYWRWALSARHLRRELGKLVERSGRVTPVGP